jgi:hypothetical protein
MLTLTLPGDLRSMARHQNLVYDLLFRASAAATRQLAHDSRFIGGQIGPGGRPAYLGTHPDFSSARALPVPSRGLASYTSS